MKQQSLATLERKCHEWNSKYPIGTEVQYHPVIFKPEYRIRTTCSEAQVLSGHTAVIWLNGESGCVALDACTPTRLTAKSQRERAAYFAELEKTLGKGKS